MLALTEMLSRHLSQTKFIIQHSGAIPENWGHKQSRSPTVCQQRVAILHFRQLQTVTVSVSSGEEIQILLAWTTAPFHLCTRRSKPEKMLNRVVWQYRRLCLWCIRAWSTGFPEVKTIWIWKGHQLWWQHCAVPRNIIQYTPWWFLPMKRMCHIMVVTLQLSWHVTVASHLVILKREKKKKQFLCRLLSNKSDMNQTYVVCKLCQNQQRVET